MLVFTSHKSDKPLQAYVKNFQKEILASTIYWDFAWDSVPPAHIISWTSYSNSGKWEDMVIPLVQMKKLGFSEAKGVVQGHPAGMNLSPALTLNWFDFQSYFLRSCVHCFL